MLELYRNIKKRRQELKLTQDQLANLTGYEDRSSIAKIESGLVDLPQSKIELFSKALNTTTSSLLGDNNRDLELLDEQQKQLLSDFESLNNVGKGEAVKQVHNLTYIPEYQLANEVIDSINTFSYVHRETPSEEPVLMAAHNDHAEDPEEIEKMRRDAERLAALQKND